MPIANFRASSSSRATRNREVLARTWSRREPLGQAGATARTSSRTGSTVSSARATLVDIARMTAPLASEPARRKHERAPFSTAARVGYLHRGVKEPSRMRPGPRHPPNLAAPVQQHVASPALGSLYCAVARAVRVLVEPPAPGLHPPCPSISCIHSTRRRSSSESPLGLDRKRDSFMTPLAMGSIWNPVSDCA